MGRNRKRRVNRPLSAERPSEMLLGELRIEHPSGRERQDKIRKTSGYEESTRGCPEEEVELTKYLVKTRQEEYKLVIPGHLFEKLQHLAEQDHTTVLDLIRRSIKMGVVLKDLGMEPGSTLILQTPGKPDRLFRVV